MTHRERVKLTLQHKIPDRVPTFFRAAYDYHRLLPFELADYIDEITDIGDYVNMTTPDGYTNTVMDNITYDELGVGRVFTGLYYDIVDSPLAHMTDYRELFDYLWPDVEAPSRIKSLRNKAQVIIDNDKILPVMGSWGGSTCLFEISWYMRGFENFLIDCAMNLKFAETLLDIQTELHIKRWSMILGEIGDLADIVCMGDDLAGQTSLIISPQMYRDLIKPRHKLIVNNIRKYTDAPIYYHSCGAITKLIPDLIDIGIDILDPIQPRCLDLDKLKQDYGHQLTFYGGIDEQQTLPFGTPQDVRDEVFRRFEQVGEDGGLILGPAHWVQVDTPADNVAAMYHAIEECRY